VHIKPLPVLLDLGPIYACVILKLYDKSLRVLMLIDPKEHMTWRLYMNMGLDRSLPGIASTVVMLC